MVAEWFGKRLPAGQQLWLSPLRPMPRATEPCPEAKGSEIVVCAQREDDPARDRLGTPIPDAPTAMEELKRKTTVSLGRPRRILISGGRPVYRNRRRTSG